MQGGQHDFRMESFEIYVKPWWYWEKKVLMQVVAKLPSQGGEQFWKEQVMVVCMQFAKRYIQDIRMLYETVY